MESLNIAFYKNAYKDVNKMSAKSLKRHWGRYGKKEGRLSSEEIFLEKYPSFDYQIYLEYNSDIVQNGINNKELAMAHFWKHGHKEGRVYKKNIKLYNLTKTRIKDYQEISKTKTTSIKLDNITSTKEQYYKKTIRGLKNEINELKMKYNEKIFCLENEIQDKIALYDKTKKEIDQIVNKRVKEIRDNLYEELRRDFEDKLNSDDKEQILNKIINKRLDKTLNQTAKINMYELTELHENTLSDINDNIRYIIDILRVYTNILFLCENSKKNHCSALTDILDNSSVIYYSNKSELYKKLENYQTEYDLVFIWNNTDVNAAKFKTPVYYYLVDIYQNTLNDYYYNLKTKKDNDRFINQKAIDLSKNVAAVFCNSSHVQSILNNFYGIKSYIFYAPFVNFYKKKPIKDYKFANREFSYGLILSNFDKKIKNSDYSVKQIEKYDNSILIGKFSTKYNKNKNLKTIEYISQDELEQYYSKIKFIQRDLFFESCSNTRVEALFAGCKINKHVRKLLNLTRDMIDNDVKVEDIYDGKTWIHGKKNTDIKITIFLISISDPQLKYAVESINKLNLTHPVLVNVIKDICPTNKAYNQMRIRCQTKYFLQMDEDMELFPDSIEVILNKKRDIVCSKHFFLNIFRLKDNYLGIGEDNFIYGIKLYNQEIMCHFSTYQNGNKSVSAVDRMWHEPVISHGYKVRNHLLIVGNHERNRTPFDIFLKYSKISNNMINKLTGNNPLKSFRDDYCRLLIPLNRLNYNCDNIINPLLQHLNVLIKKEFSQDSFDKLENVQLKIKDMIDDNYKELYHFSNYINFDFSKITTNFDINAFFELFNFNKQHNVDHIYALAGIVNRLFDNYKYSFNSYPRYIDTYLSNLIGRVKVHIISNQIPNLGGAATGSYSLFKYLENDKRFDVKCIFIDHENLLNMKKLKITKEYLNKFSDCDIITYDEINNGEIDITTLLMNKINSSDILIFRYPQCDYLNNINFRRLKKICNKLVSVFGGGFRFNISKVSENNRDLTLDEVVDKITENNQGMFEIEFDEMELKLNKFKNILRHSDYITSNTDLYSQIFEGLFPEKYIGHYYFSSILKSSPTISQYNAQSEDKWNNRQYEIGFITSSLTRTVKNFKYFSELTKKINKKILIVGKNANKMKKYVNKNMVIHEYSHDVFNEMKKCKLIVMTSLFEASPNVLFEAISCGCNILTSDTIGNISLFREECVVDDYFDQNEWKNKINNLTKKQYNPLKDNVLKKNKRHVDSFKNRLVKMNTNKSNKLVLLVTFLEEYIDQPRLHYSKSKGYLLADSLINAGYIPFFLTNQTSNISYEDKYYYINIKHLKPKVLAKFNKIYFVLHNKEYLDPLCETDLIENINKAKKLNESLKVINKTCIYPSPLDKYFDSYEFFDKIILQTKQITIPKSITNKVLKMTKKLNIEKYKKYCKKHHLKCKFDYSEMTFSNEQKIEINNKLDLDKSKINIIYMGRLNQENGMNLVFLTKLMKQLGKNYHLYILSGSFKLPNKLKCPKYSTKNKPENLKLLQNYFDEYSLDHIEDLHPKKWNQKTFKADKDDYDKCNITVLPLRTYGEHYEVIAQFDIALGFSDKKGKNAENGSAKLFDYMFSNLKIVVEGGWENAYYVENYNFGTVLSNNTTVNEMKNAIAKLSKTKKNSRYEDYLKENNNVVRFNRLV